MRKVYCSEAEEPVKVCSNPTPTKSESIEDVNLVKVLDSILYGTEYSLEMLKLWITGWIGG